MKRRNFIINSTLALAGTMFLAGCTKDEIILEANKIAKRKFKNIEIPLLGFGCMRLPLKNGKIDIEEFEKMTQYAMDNGANYFDTAYMYMSSKSENAVGKVLKNYKRGDVILADKNPLAHLKSIDDVKKIFEEQLQKCKTDYFDFYMAHNINSHTYEAYKNYKVYEQLKEFKRQGLIKYLGFSFHGTTEMLENVLKEHSFDFVQLQMNYFDWNNINAKEQYEIIQEKKLPIIVMEPLRGGSLSLIPKEAQDVLSKAYKKETPSSFGLKWAASKKNVISVLSGMSSLEQMKENIETFKNFKIFGEEEEKVAQELAKIIQSKGEIACTTCKYCTEVCPLGINIPAAFAMYNQYKISGNGRIFPVYYDSLKESERPDKCIGCGLCNRNCPQSIDIPKMLKVITDEYKKLSV